MFVYVCVWGGGVETLHTLGKWQHAVDREGPLDIMYCRSRRRNERDGEIGSRWISCNGAKASFAPVIT